MQTNMKDELKACLMVKNIPSGIGHTLQLMTDTEIEVDDLIKHIKPFPVICVRLVMVSNSAWAAPRSEITDIKQACLHLGLKMVKSISIALLVSQQFNSQKCKGFSEREYWLSALVMSDLMATFESSQNHPEKNAETAYLIGLIHNLGILAIAEIAPEKMSNAFLRANNSDISISDALSEVLGMSYLEATQTILENWGLPPTIVNSYGPSTDVDDYSRCVEQALQQKNKIDFLQVPFKLWDEEAGEGSEIEQKIIAKSEYYDEMCGLYCR